MIAWRTDVLLLFYLAGLASGTPDYTHSTGWREDLIGQQIEDTRPGLQHFAISRLANRTFLNFCPIHTMWGGWGSNPRPADYEKCGYPHHASCTNDTNHRTNGTHHSGIIWRAGPRTGPRPQRPDPLVLLLCETPPTARPDYVCPVSEPRRLGIRGAPPLCMPLTMSFRRYFILVNQTNLLCSEAWQRRCSHPCDLLAFAASAGSALPWPNPRTHARR